jgi:hypothetical protein
MAEPETEIPQTPVESTFLKSAGYSAETKTLAIAFRDGTLIHYGNVKPDIWDAFLEAESKGRFFHQVIRGRYAGLKIEAPTGTCPACRGAGPMGALCWECGRANYEAPEAKS